MKWPKEHLGGSDLAVVAARVREDILAGLPGAFARLVYLSSLRDENSGTYRHYALEARHTPEQCHAALLACHREIFYAWLRTSLEEQRDELRSYLGTLDEDRTTVLTTWKKLEPFRLYVPAEATRGERELFLSDLRILGDLFLQDAEGSPQPRT